MTFSSLIFLTAFFPITLLGYWSFSKSRKLENAWLIVVSLVFYGWSGVQYLVIILVSSLVNYLLGFLVGPQGSRRKRYLVLAVIFNLLILGFFKYFNFLVDNINVVCNQWFGFTIQAPRIPLPIGISFFTFQILSYVIDVYRGKVQPQKNYFYVLLYIAFFPQLIAGPIVRYIDIEKEIITRRSTIDDIEAGIHRFILGLCKKVLIANQVALVADRVFANIGSGNMQTAWLGILCYTLQIFFDFSGYSDMAIGMGRIFGFHFLENFNYPYISKNIQEFWRRWHISLSSWFKDYVYIPLGGNRKGHFRTGLNLLIVFFLTGFWHGAGWNFIVWGLFNGLFLLLERNRHIKAFLGKMPSVLSHLYTMLVVMSGWVFFQSDSLETAVVYLGKMFSFDFSASTINPGMTPILWITIALGILFCTPVIGWIRKRKLCRTLCEKHGTAMTICHAILGLAGLALCIVKLSTGGFNPFIYFRF